MPQRSTIAPWASLPAQQRLAELEAHHIETDSGQIVDSVRRALTRHHRRIAEGIPLYAGTNILSPSVAALHDVALSTRPALGWPGAKLQTAVADIEHLEVMATRQVAASMRAAYAEVRYLSATMANLAAYCAFTEPGDAIAVLSPEAGGHTSHQQNLGTAGIRGLRVHHLPYSVGLLDVHAGEIDEFTDRVRPRIIVLGGSVALLPHNLHPVRAAADRVGAVVVYDASHTAGLIAAGEVPNPLDAGADVVTFSTYKTYAGPAGGAAVTNNIEHAERLADAAYPTMLSNYDPARLGPLAVAAREAVEQAPPWAGPTIDYARELAARLNTLGLIVVGRRHGYTRTHQVVVDAQPLGGGQAAVRRLESAGIYTGTCRLPWQAPGTPAEGLRLGVQEWVRSGAGFTTIGPLAQLICAGLTEASHDTREAVLDLCGEASVDLWGRRMDEECPTELSGIR